MTKNIKKIVVKIGLMILSTVLLVLNINQVEAETTTSTTSQSFFQASNAPQYIARVYWYGSAIVSGVAVLIIVIAGVNYLRSMGNTEVIQRSKQLIAGALAGLFLVFGGYFILKTIDPRLVNLRIEVPSLDTSVAEADTCQGLLYKSCSPNGKITTCRDRTTWKCVKAPDGINNLRGTDYKYDEELSRIQCVNGKYQFTHEKLLSRYYEGDCGCDGAAQENQVLFATANCASGKQKADKNMELKNYLSADCYRTDRVCVPYTGSTGN